MKEHEEIMVLAHEAWPGFAKAFWIIFSLACVYLGLLLFLSFGKVDSGASSHDSPPAHHEESQSKESDHHG
ncbi:MAG: hypothetical protein ABFS09_00385 [Thermodesulfobacteriota bacterium]